jgi:hypothetical protein
MLPILTHLSAKDVALVIFKGRDMKDLLTNAFKNSSLIKDKNMHISWPSVAIIFAALLLSSCAPIERYSALEEPVNVVRTAPIGTPVYTIKKTADLPNVSGHADIWGGKVDKGWTRLVYLGRTANGNAAFQLENVDIQTNETTMQRYRPLIAASGAMQAATVNQSYQGSATSNSYSGNSTSTVSINPALAMAIATPDAQTAIVPAGSGQFSTNKKSLHLGDVNVEILNFDEMSITYTLSQNQTIK